MESFNTCDELWYRRWADNWPRDLRRCSRCVYDERTPGIQFDENGVCDACHMHDMLCEQYPAGEAGWAWLEETAERIRKRQRNRPFDVAVGISGGCDSSYLIHTAVQLGLRPLAVHFDNTWDSTIAVENIHCVLDKLGVELYTYVVDNEEYDDIYRAFLQAGTPDLECPTDIGLATTLYLACEKYNIPFIFEGHNFRTEGSNPLGWLYMDARYIQSVHKRYGQRKMKTFPNLWFWKQMKWMVLKRIKKIRPLWRMSYVKDDIKRFLADTYGWQWYGGHHLENRITEFYHTYFQPRRFGFDQRPNGFAAQVRTGQMDRDEAIEELSGPPDVDMDLVEMVRKRLGYTDAEFDRILDETPRRYYTDFKTYKKRFERLRPLFGVLARADLIPMSFYLKYTKPASVGLSALRPELLSDRSRTSQAELVVSGEDSVAPTRANRDETDVVAGARER